MSLQRKQMFVSYLCTAVDHGPCVWSRCNYWFMHGCYLLSSLILILPLIDFQWDASPCINIFRCNVVPDLATVYTADDTHFVETNIWDPRNYPFYQNYANNVQHDSLLHCALCFYESLILTLLASFQPKLIMIWFVIKLASLLTLMLMVSTWDFPLHSSVNTTGFLGEVLSSCCFR